MAFLVFCGQLLRIRYGLGLVLGLGLDPSRIAWQRTQIAASLLDSQSTIIPHHQYLTL